MSLLQLLQLCDSGFPNGGYAFSDGLETLTQQGVVHDTNSFKSYLQGQLASGWLRTDGAACALAWHHHGLDHMLDCIKVVESVRVASRRMGSTLAKSAQQVWGIEVTGQHQAVVFAQIAQQLGIERSMALAGFVQAYLAGRGAAATRLFAIGGFAVQRVVAELYPDTLEAVQWLEGCTLEDLGGFAPQQEHAAYLQPTLELRLFQS